MPTIQIVTSAEPVVLDASVATKCGYVRRLLETAGMSEGTDALSVPLEIESQPFPPEPIKLVKKYLEHFYAAVEGAAAPPRPSIIPRPLVKPLDVYLSQWEKDFIAADLLVDGDVWQHDMLMMVYNASDRLDCEPLKDLLLSWVAWQIEELSMGVKMMDASEKLRQFFNIANDWTEEEMGHLQKEMEYYELQESKR